MGLRGRRFKTAILSAAWFALAVGCSTTAKELPAPAEAGPVGPTESACQVQGYFDETDGGQCPTGTCVVLAFDTNGGRLPCCTSIASGPGQCADGGGLGSVDATVTDAQPEASLESGSGDADIVDAGASQDGALDAEAPSDASTDARD